MATTWVCDPTLVQECPCNHGDGAKICDCADEPAVGGVCGKCASPMVRVDVDTGELIGAVANG